MSKVVFISDKIKKGLIENVVFCTTDQIKEIISNYNSDSGLTKNEIFILGYNLSTLSQETKSHLSYLGRVEERQLLDEIEDLVRSIMSVDHTTSLLSQDKQESKKHYFKLHSYGNNGFTMKVDIVVKHGEVYLTDDVINHLRNTGFLSELEEKQIDDVEEISEEEFYND